MIICTKKAIKKVRFKNTLKDWYSIAKKYGFEATQANAKAKNPYLRLKGGLCLVMLAGGLLMLTDSAIHFGEDKLYLRRWCSDHGNSPFATVVSKQLVYENGKLIERNENYYRVAGRHMLRAIAEWRGVPISKVELDHINRKRGDLRRCNLRPADSEQNNWNKDSIKIEHAFFTFADLDEKLASGEWALEEI
jgi:hypothetical protein